MPYSIQKAQRRRRNGSEETSHRWKLSAVTLVMMSQITRRADSFWHGTHCVPSRRSPCTSASCSLVCWACVCAPIVHIATTERTLVRTSSEATPKHKAAFLDAATPYSVQSNRRKAESYTITSRRSFSDFTSTQTVISFHYESKAMWHEQTIS